MESEKHIESLQKAVKSIKIADHMLYVTYPVVKDKRLLLKALENVSEALIDVINAILQYDYLFKRIQLYKNDARLNFETFLNKCAKRYNISDEETFQLTEILKLAESHKKSPLEFLRKERVVIMSDSLKTNIIEPEKLKKYLSLAKMIVEKARFGMNIK